MTGIHPVLDLIDGATRDHEVSRDAMRWTPDSGNRAGAEPRATIIDEVHRWPADTPPPADSFVMVRYHHGLISHTTSGMAEPDEAEPVAALRQTLARVLNEAASR